MPARKVFRIRYLVFGIRSAKSLGFTLIELLIVITIIGILASLTLASFGGAQAKARDGVRKSDLAQIKRALELAKADCSGNAYYPFVSAAATLGPAQNAYNTSGTNPTTEIADYLSHANLKYISSVIKDPKDVDPQKYSFWTETSATGTDVCPDTAVSPGFTHEGADNFVLAVKLERTQDIDAVSSRDKCSGKPGNGVWNAAGNNPGYYVVCNN